jgi:hypothetical protein
VRNEVGDGYIDDAQIMTSEYYYDFIDDCGVNDADEYSIVAIPEGDPHLSVFEKDPAVNLKRNLNNYNQDVLRNQIMHLFKARRRIKETMKWYSGIQHGKDVYDFVDMVMHNVVGGFTVEAVYYFYLRCEEKVEVDDDFYPFLQKTATSGVAIETGASNDAASWVTPSNVRTVAAAAAKTRTDLNSSHATLLGTQKGNRAESVLDKQKENQTNMLEMRREDREGREEEMNLNRRSKSSTVYVDGNADMY